MLDITSSHFPNNSFHELLPVNTDDETAPVAVVLQKGPESREYVVENSALKDWRGLECGVLATSYPDMDMISIGPTIENVHSPAERLFIPSVARTMDLLVATLEES